MKESEKKETNGFRIKEERKRLKLIQQDVATRCGVHRVQWGRYERGEQNMSAKVLAKFGELGADTGYILTGKRSLVVGFQDEALAIQNARDLGEQAGQRGDTAAKHLHDYANRATSQLTDLLAVAESRNAVLHTMIGQLCLLNDENFERAFLAIGKMYLAQELSNDENC